MAGFRVVLVRVLLSVDGEARVIFFDKLMLFESQPFESAICGADELRPIDSLIHQSTAPSDHFEGDPCNVAPLYCWSLQLQTWHGGSHGEWQRDR